MQQITQLLQSDNLRLDALDCVHQLDLPQGYIAAGFVRNLVWDHLHQKSTPTPLTDVDVVYYDQNEQDYFTYTKYQAELTKQMPQLNWQVKNQALMHKRNGDRPYKDVIDAMSYWPEKETAVAIRKLAAGQYQCISAFGFESLFALQITHNPKRPVEVFQQRLHSKNWLNIWPKLVVTSSSSA